MSSVVLLVFVISYFLVLMGVAWVSSGRSADNATFFMANRNSRWYLVAFGMIGTSLSGVTFVSVPGRVGSVGGDQFAYFQFVLGCGVGFVVIALVLLPLYYRLRLTSIYSYIEQRMGRCSYQTAAAIFLVSRGIGAAFRLYLVVIVLQHFIFDSFGVPFWVTVLLSLVLIWSYTFKGGLKTIIITDTLQTFFLVTSVVFTIYFICSSLDLNILTSFETVKNSSYSQIFFFNDWVSSKLHFGKQFVGGVFVTIGMSGLDQDLMQKHLSCKNIGEAQKNMFTFTAILMVVNLFFLSVGALLYIYAQKNGISIPTDSTGTVRSDFLFPEIALRHLGVVPAILFMLGLTAATFATTDSALTALTTSFCVDFLGMDKKEDANNQRYVRHRNLVHIAFSFLIFLVVVVFNAINDKAVVSAVFTVASYTYGPLLGLYAFGLFVKKRTLNDFLTPVICIIAPIVCYLLNQYSKDWMYGYVFDNELILLNGILTFLGCLIISKKIS